MKKLIYTLLLLFVMPLIGRSQNDSINNSEQHHYKKQTSIDINLLGIGINETKPINEKYAFIYGIQGGFIYNYFITQTNQRQYAAAYAEMLGVTFGINYYHIKRMQFIGRLRLALPYRIVDIANFQSPFFGLSFATIIKISPMVSIGTNIDYGTINLSDRLINTLSTSFIFVRIIIKK